MSYIRVKAFRFYGHLVYIDAIVSFHFQMQLIVIFCSYCCNLQLTTRSVKKEGVGTKIDPVTSWLWGLWLSCVVIISWVILWEFQRSCHISYRIPQQPLQASLKQCNACYRSTTEGTTVIPIKFPERSRARKTEKWIPALFYMATFVTNPQDVIRELVSQVIGDRRGWAVLGRHWYLIDDWQQIGDARAK